MALSNVGEYLRVSLKEIQGKWKSAVCIIVLSAKLETTGRRCNLSKFLS